MNEYICEIKNEWATDLHGFPQNGLVSRLFAEVPKPKEAYIRKALPFWELTPLQCKLPDLGIEGVYFTRGKAGHSASQRTKPGATPDVDFITYDPYCYEHDSRKYDSMHDRHLANFFKSESLCAFLRKIGLLDNENYPKCSVGDMNAYRQYLFRLHKDKVKREYNRILDEKDENKLWRDAHISAVQNYFRRFHQEVRLIRTMGARKECARQQRAKAMKPLQLLKRWDRRLKEIEEQKKDTQLMKEEERDREARRYKKVLERGKANLEIRPMNTLKNMRVQKLKADEATKKKQEQDEFNKYTKIESYLFNKAFLQSNRLELLKQLAILNDRGREVTRKRKALAMQRLRKRFEQELYCRKHNMLPERKPSPELTEMAKKNLAKYKKRMELGLDNIIHVLSTLENQRSGVTHTLPIRDNLLKKVANQMVKRAVLLNLQCASKHLVTTMMNYCLAPGKHLLRYLPQMKKDGSLLVPTEECLKEAHIIPEMKEVIHTFVVNGEALIDEVKQSQDTSGLRAFLTKKHTLLMTILSNGRRLLQLVNDRVELLKTIKDPYHDLPYIKQELFNIRKPMPFGDLVDKVHHVLTIADPKVLETAGSGMGQVANIMAYAKVALGYKVIREGSDTSLSTEATPMSPSEWDRLRDLHCCLKENYNNLEFEKIEDEANIDAVNDWADQVVAYSHQDKQNV